MKSIKQLKALSKNYADKYFKNPNMKYDFLNGAASTPAEQYVIMALAAGYLKYMQREISYEAMVHMQKQIIVNSIHDYFFEDGDYSDNC